MKLLETYETEVGKRGDYLEIRQTDQMREVFAVLLSPYQARLVAQELLRLADEVEGGADVSA
ncbi:hypothetical protein [Ectopseudomonas mendocina]|uniref:hypothetical protein n=1 Tax=Ectopseudomonas mendocina TaxID=300 RepID=UPI00376F025A